MSLRSLIPGLALVLAATFSCENQGGGVGSDVVDELCELNREAVLALHSKDGMAKENSDFSYTYCDNSFDTNGDGIPDAAEVQGSCKELKQGDVDIVVTECKRNGARIQERCWHEMEAILQCLKTELENADSRIGFFSSHFDCWEDVNGNGVYDGGVYWTWPEDGSRPVSDLNHQESCNATHLSSSNAPVLGDTGTHQSCGLTDGAQGLRQYSRCYFMKELPRRGDETKPNGNVTMKQIVCPAEYAALNACSKEPAEFLRARLATAAASGTAP